MAYKSRKNKKRNTGGKKQKLWLMKGCSRKKNRKMKGGGCGCGLNFGGNVNNVQNGGMRMGGSFPALIGEPWNGSVSGWPGVTDSRNFFPLNTYQPFDPQTQVSQERLGQIFPLENSKYLVKGGSRRNKTLKKRNKRGGGLFGDNLNNMARSIQYGLGTTYNTMYGYPAPVDPMPYKDQYNNRFK